MIMFLAAHLLPWILLDCDPLPALRWADAAYRDGRPEVAAAVYDGLSIVNPHRPLLFQLNRGHAHLRAGHLALALVAYHRAERQRLLRDGRVESALCVARDLVTDPVYTIPPPASWWDFVRRHFWAAGAAAVLVPWWLVLVSLATLISPLPASSRWLRRTAVITTQIAIALLVTGLFVLVPDIDERPWVVVARDSSVLREGNGHLYPPCEQNGVAITLATGVEGRLKGERPNGWFWVELRDGQTGWLPRSATLVCGTD